jgi:hypothetical protein
MQDRKVTFQQAIQMLYCKYLFFVFVLNLQMTIVYVHGVQCDVLTYIFNQLNNQFLLTEF